MSDESDEPFVIVDRSAAPPRRRWTAILGRKPALLLIDREGRGGSGLDIPLAAEGFDVYRTTSLGSARELLEAHPSLLMALVRMDLPAVDPAPLLRELQQARPGLWIGLLGDLSDRSRIAEGYAAGAVDVFSLAAPPIETVERLARSVPWALRRREAAERRRVRRRRRFSPYLGSAAMLAIAFAIGVALAAGTRSWIDSREEQKAKIDRLLTALEAARPGFDRSDREFDRWQRSEQILIQHEAQQTLRSTSQAQLEQDRLRDLMRVVSPRYPTVPRD